MGSSSRAPGSHFNKSSQVSNLISLGRRLFSSFLGTSARLALSALLSATWGASSDLTPSFSVGWAGFSVFSVRAGFASSFSLTRSVIAGVFSEIGCSATLFSVSFSFLSSAEVSASAFSPAPEFCAEVLAIDSGTATCSARTGLANRAYPIIKEQAPIDSLRIL